MTGTETNASLTAVDRFVFIGNPILKLIDLCFQVRASGFSSLTFFGDQGLVELLGQVANLRSLHYKLTVQQVHVCRFASLH